MSALAAPTLAAPTAASRYSLEVPQSGPNIIPGTISTTSSDGSEPPTYRDNSARDGAGATFSPSTTTASLYTFDPEEIERMAKAVKSTLEPGFHKGLQRSNSGISAPGNPYKAVTRQAVIAVTNDHYKGCIPETMRSEAIAMVCAVAIKAYSESAKQDTARESTTSLVNSDTLIRDAVSNYFSLNEALARSPKGQTGSAEFPSPVAAGAGATAAGAGAADEKEDADDAEDAAAGDAIPAPLRDAGMCSGCSSFC